MKLLELTVNNWGVFRGSHNFRLEPIHSPDDPTHHLTVIKGHNGAGKSTLFQALALVLHGSYALGDRVSQRDYDDFLMNHLHRYNKRDNSIISEEGSISLAFRYVQSGRPLDIQITRQWHRNTHSVREELDVLQDGKPPDIEREDYQFWINDLVPSGLIPLSLFDGEQLDTLANPEEHDELLKKTTKRLLGLDLVSQLQTDLDYYTLHQGGNRKIEDLREVVLQYQSELEKLNSQLDQAHHRIERLNSTQAELEVDLIQQERLLASEGGTYAARRPNLQARLGVVQEEIEVVSAKLLTMSSGLLPFTLAPHLCRALSKRLVQELHIRQRQIAQELWQESIDRFQAVLQSDQLWDDLDISDSLQKDIADRLSQAMQEENIETDTSPLIHRLSEVKQKQLQEWITKTLHAVPHKVVMLGRNLRGLRDEYDRIQTDLQRAPDDEVLEPIHNEILRLENALEEIHSTQRKLGERIGALEYQKEEKVRQLQGAAESLQKAQASKRKLKLAEQSKLALRAYEDALTRQRLSSLEQMLISAFNTLCRKEHLLASAAINPDTFNVELHNADGYVLSLNEFSAGERQLYALSLLWALRRVSGRELPLIIDTPMARLDEAHRWRMIEKYIPAVSEQVILFTTDTELDANLLEQARPYLARLYQLDYDTQKEATKVSIVDTSPLTCVENFPVGVSQEGNN
jgi:DNA sulfur modification protein DndD